MGGVTRPDSPRPPACCCGEDVERTKFSRRPRKSPACATSNFTQPLLAFSLQLEGHQGEPGRRRTGRRGTGRARRHGDVPGLRRTDPQVRRTAAALAAPGFLPVPVVHHG